MVRRSMANARVGVLSGSRFFCPRVPVFAVPRPAPPSAAGGTAPGEEERCIFMIASRIIMHDGLTAQEGRDAGAVGA